MTNFTGMSSHYREGFAPEAIRNRTLLLGIMTAADRDHNGQEWWHYHQPGRQGFIVLSASDVPGRAMESRSLLQCISIVDRRHRVVPQHTLPPWLRSTETVRNRRGTSPSISP